MCVGVCVCVWWVCVFWSLLCECGVLLFVCVGVYVFDVIVFIVCVECCVCVCG